MRFPRATDRTAALGGAITGLTGTLAGNLSPSLRLAPVADTVLTWVYLLLGFLAPVVVLVVGMDYLSRGNRTRNVREAADGFAETGKRMLIWFGVFAATLIGGALISTAIRDDF